MTNPTEDPIDPQTPDDAEESPQSADAPQEGDGSLPLLSWPPPGLGRIQGDLWILVRKMLLASGVLVLPLLLVITLPQSQPGLGPLGDSWWITLITTFFGLVFFLDAAVCLVRILGRTRRVLQERYSLQVIGSVLADAKRDGGFLLQGARHYSMLSEEERKVLGRLRVWTPIAYAGAGLWLIVAFSVLVVLAARGVVSPGSVVVGTLLPTIVLLFTGMVLRAVLGSMTKRARKAWFKQPWSQDLSRHDGSEWRDAAIGRGIAAERDSPVASWTLRLAMSGMLIVVFVSVVPPMTLVPVSSVGAILSSMSSGWFSRVQRRGAEVEPYRNYRLAPDPSISAQEAGDILHTLLNVGLGEQTREGMLSPAGIYEDRWLPESPVEEWSPQSPAFWGESLWTELQGGGSAELRAYLGQVEAHPAHAEFSRLARAQSIDVIGGRYEIPFPIDMVSWSLPIPRYAAIREAAQAHLGIAALRASEGRHAEAEETIREVISVGFLLMEESPNLLGHLIGGVLVQAGGEALVPALLADGRAGDADALSGSVAAARRAVAMMQSAGGPGAQARLRSLMTVAANPERRRSLRWEYLQFVAGVTPCMNLQRVVFGPNEEYTEWVDGMRSSLVRFPADDAYFDMALRGIVAGAEPSLMVGLLAVAMGGTEAQGSCAQLVLNLGPLM